LQPAVVARAVRDAFVFDGAIPWVTGAAHADYLVIGGVTESGLQVLAVLPTAQPGVHVEPPLDLTALQGSMTAGVRLERVVLERRWLLAGPAQTDALPELTKRLDAKDADVRYYALATLLWMGKDGRKAGERILHALDDPSPMVRIKAIHTASLLENDSAAIKALLSILKDERADVRLAALESLKKIGKKTALAATLYPLMSDPDREIALNALKAVVELDRSTKTLDALLQLTETESGLSIAQTNEARQAVVLCHFSNEG
jgi:hypothetical protein